MFLPTFNGQSKGKKQNEGTTHSGYSLCAQRRRFVSCTCGVPRSGTGKKGMVVAADPIAANVGLKILKEGGNAVDAAVAVGFALSVTYPGAGNIGGGGFMVMRFADGTVKSLDYRETAPAAAKRDMFLDKNGNFIEQKSTRGHLACGVPGSVAGMLYAQRRVRETFPCTSAQAGDRPG